ncbi:protoporphyrinogen oxidase HemJ [Moraxella oblonga]|uniref:protoporphyrinogen oxidase HemJ n=1 Tax=Moraxella oblonga TaxID=200413 RepID=UPI00083021B3|nr:protoporphyrinogen oxidase HemJ [Moraxella oblonga]
MFLILKSLHLIAMVCWFAGIFYLPRLFVYHAMSDDKLSQQRFVIMERKLYRGIMNPAMMATWLFGLSMVLSNWQIYKSQGWLHAKLTLVVLLTIYHIICGKYRLKLVDNPHLKSDKFWRIFNEVPVFILVAVVFLVVTKPF